MESTDFVTKSSMTTDEAVIIKEWILADAKVLYECRRDD